MKRWFVSELPKSQAASAHDVQMVLNHLTSRGDFDMNRIAMFGEGSEGGIAILAAAADQRIKALEVLEPWRDWLKWLAESKIIPDEERQKYLKPEFLAQVVPFDPTLWLPKVKSQSIRIQNVRPNPYVPEFSQKSIEAAAPEKAEIEQFGDARA
jgi:acetyl esterase/lipase